MDPKIISFINMKGGVGKTTFSVNVAYALSQFHNKKVLLVDCDPQFNASTYLLDDTVYLKHIAKKKTVRDIFLSPREDGIDTVRGVKKKVTANKVGIGGFTHNVYKNQTGGLLDILPSTLNLMEAETSKRGSEKKLGNFIQSKAKAYDFVILDCPPTISIFSLAAVLASKYYLVPIRPDPLSTIGLPLLEKWLTEESEDAGIEIEQLGIVFCMVRGPLPNSMRQVMDDLRAERGASVFNNHLSLMDDVSKSVEEHKPVFNFKPSSKTASQIVEITKELLSRF